MKSDELSKKIKEKATVLIEQIKKHPKVVAITAGIAVVCLTAGIIVVVQCTKKEEIVYRETTVEFGELSVGITESSSVDMENVTQSFDLDISALIKEESDSSSSESSQKGQMGGMNQIAGFS